MGNAVAKLNPNNQSFEDLQKLKVSMFGKNWTKFCNDTFEGGYQAVHVRMRKLNRGCKKDVAEKNTDTITKFVPNPVDRALFLVSKSVYQLDWKSRNFLCDLIKFGYMSLSDRQEKWLSDLEKKFVQ